jgi:hypothetical protein
MEEIQMIKKHMKKCSPSLAIKEMQIKPHLDFTSHLLELLPSRTPPTINVGEYAGKKGTLIHCWLECNLVQLLGKTILRLLKKLNIDLPHDLAIPLLGIYPKE